MSRKFLLVALGALVSMATLAALQRGPGGPGGPGGRGGRGPMPSYYTHTSTPLGAVDTTAADRACGSAQGHARLVCLAGLLSNDSSLDAALRARLVLPYAMADGARWSNFPPNIYTNRVGVTLGELSPAQRGVVKALLKTAAGVAAGEGYDELEQILNADDFLKNSTGNTGIGSGNFQIAFIGTPAPTGTWELYFGGHHLAFGSTYKDGTMVGATPSFRGVEPFTPFKENGRDNAPMAQEQAAFAAMLGALDAGERGKATLPQTYTDLIVGPQKDDNFPSTKAGVRVGDLSEAKRTLVLRAIEAYVSDVDAPNAATLLAKYRTELPDTFLAFSGTTTVNAENDYIRIDGPSLWLEFSMQPGRMIPGMHPHSVWRDRKTDYGGNR